MGLEAYGISKDILDILSYESRIGKSLKKTTLHKVEENILFDEIQNIIDFYIGNELFDKENFDKINYRIKSMDSCRRKYKRYFPNREINKVFNDILGFRIISEYEEILKQDLSLFNVVDITKGKANDDGYRGLHLYYIKSNYHYPIEIQVNSYKDRIFADWTHMMVYKYIENKDISRYLRKEFDNGNINSEKEFMEVLNNVLSSCKEI